MVNSFRNAWSADTRTGRGSSSLGASLGGTDAVFGHDLSYLLSGTYSYGEEVRAEEVRARALAASGGETDEVDRFVGSTGRTSVLWGGLASLSSLIGQHTRAFFHGTWSRTADNEARLELGTSENHGGIPLQIQRLRFVERSVHSAQIGAEHRRSRSWRARTASGTSAALPYGPTMEQSRRCVCSVRSSNGAGATASSRWRIASEPAGELSSRMTSNSRAFVNVT